MEINVWTRLFARAVTSLCNLFESLNSPSEPNNGIASPNAQEKDASLISTSKSVTILAVIRDPMLTTPAGVFGKMYYSGEEICFTLENPADLIQPGTYSAQLDKSPHLGYVCPHLWVPERDAAAGGDAGLRVHVANYISQLRGCVAVGLQPRPDCMEQSQAAFDKLMAVLPQEFTVEICSTPQ